MDKKPRRHGAPKTARLPARSRPSEKGEGESAGALVSMATGEELPLQDRQLHGIRMATPPWVH